MSTPDRSRCLICGCAVRKQFVARVLQRHDVSYFRCQGCGFIQTEEPHWLSEAYAGPEGVVSIYDVSSAKRNLQMAEIVSRIILRHFDPHGRFIDFGGGTGLFVRLMRDRGFGFSYREDAHSRNAYARGFEVAEPPNERGAYELLTAFEVFEHLADPIGTAGDMFRFSDSILFSTALTPAADANPETWAYFAPYVGQHIAFYTQPALMALAERFGARLVTDGRDTHMLCRGALRGGPRVNLGAREPGVLGFLERALAGALNRVRLRQGWERANLIALTEIDFRRVLNTARGGGTRTRPMGMKDQQAAEAGRGPAA